MEFVRSAIGQTRWVESAVIAPPDLGAKSQWFGWGLDLNGDLLLIGEPHYGHGEGRAYMLNLSTGGFRASGCEPDGSVVFVFGVHIGVAPQAGDCAGTLVDLQSPYRPGSPVNFYG
ncbi:MAG: hypothetical protein ACOC0P_06550 [Planctomycetota bacterium]